MKKILLITALGFFLGVNAQVKTNNFGVGISPFGMMYVKKEYKQNSKVDKVKIDYKSYLNAHLFYERQLGGAGLLIEGTYAMAKFEKMDNNIINLYEPDATYAKDVNIYSAAFYGSYAFNKQKRLQVPVYVGIGADFVNGDPINLAFVSLVAKARLKFYISNKIALYGGYNYKTGLGMDGSDNKDSKAPEKSTYLNVNYADMGVTFSF